MTTPTPIAITEESHALHGYIWSPQTGWQPHVMPYLPHEDSCDDLLARHGYAKALWNPSASMLSPGLFEVWMNREATFPYCLFLALPDDSSEVIWLASTPDYLDFLAKYGNPGLLTSVHGELEWLREIIEKLFQAWHGHGTTAYCRECDPRAWERRQEHLRQKRQSGK